MRTGALSRFLIDLYPRTGAKCTKKQQQHFVSISLTEADIRGKQCKRRGSYHAQWRTTDVILKHLCAS